jgi:hypothetical protein
MAQFRDGHRVHVFRDPQGNQLGARSRSGTITGVAEDTIFVLLDPLPGEAERDLWTFGWHDGMAEFSDVQTLAAHHMQRIEQRTPVSA